MMTYFEALNELYQEIGKFFDRGYNLRVESDKSRFNLYSRCESTLRLIKEDKPIFRIHTIIEPGRRGGERKQPIDGSQVRSIADSVESVSRNAIELTMSIIKHSVDSRSGDYEYFCSLGILKDKCFFTPSGLHWGDWETYNGFICSGVKMCRDDRLPPIDRAEWIEFKKSNERKKGVLNERR